MKRNLLRNSSTMLFLLFCSFIQFAFADAAIPDIAIPLHYFITIHPDVKNLTFKGEERIEFQLTKPSKTVTLNSLKLRLSDASVSDQKFPKPLKAAIKSDDQAETATFSFPAMLAKGLHTLRLTWSGKLQLEPSGLFYIDYKSADGKPQRMLSTQFEAVDARRMFPCWDEPAYKATFQLTTIVPKNFLAVSNMPVEKENNVSSKEKQVQFFTSPKMSSYLLVFVAGNLKYLSGGSDGVKIRVIAPSGEEQNGKFALHWAEKVLHSYNDYYGIKYPLPKLDLIAEPGGFGGAMENWGGITFIESLLLFDPKNSSQGTKEDVASVVSHEMAHQWTGDLVTMKWWDDLWLNEGFADWMSDKVTDYFFPEWHIPLRLAAESDEAMSTDALSTTQPIERQVKTGRQADQIFDEITYNKAAAIIRMLEQYLGPKNFRNGIVRYMKLHKYSNATSHDLWSALAYISHKPVEPVALGWLRQPGFPQITVDDTCNQGKQTLTFSQKPFTLLPEKATPNTWEIPIEVTSVGSGEPYFDKNLLLTDKTTLDLPASAENSCSLPVMLTNQGYYRVQYPPTFLSHLGGILSTQGVLNVAETRLLFDTWAFAENGSYPASSYLELAEAFKNKINYGDWNQILGTLQTLDSLETDPKEKDQFHAFVRTLLQPVFESVGWNAKPGEDENITLLRTNVIAALGTYGDKAVIDEASKRFNDYLKSPNSLSSNLRPAVFRIVGKYANQETYNELHSLGQKASTSEEKLLFYRSLASARDPQLASQTLQISLSNELDPTNATYLIASVAYRGEQPLMAWEFAEQNTKTLEQRLSNFEMGFFLESLIPSFHGGSTANEVAQYLSKNFSSDFAPIIAKGLQINNFEAHLKTTLMPSVNQWIMHHE